ncbi:hypothetical protein HDU99_002232 [Rhizoclosmatium hyalinum]|nr:hypothetical protein HDU99_002232 [Rhizoclosmatium hyalinum]
MPSNTRPHEEEKRPELDLLAALPPPPTLPTTPLKTLTTLVLMPFFQGMFYGLGEGVARLLVFKWWGIENFTTIPTAGVTSSTASKLANDDKKSGFLGMFRGGKTEKTVGLDIGSDVLSLEALFGIRDGCKKEREGLYLPDGVAVLEETAHVSVRDAAREFSFSRLQ